MSFWKLAIVCLAVFTVSADLDADIELISDLAKLHSLRGAIESRRGGSSGFGGAETELELFDDETVELIGASSGGSRGGSMGGGSRGGSMGGSKSSSFSKPSFSKPSVSKPSTSKPMTKPSTSHTKPPTSKPATPSSKPVTHKPATPKPVTPKPSTKPVTPKPVTPKPSTKPVTPKPSTKPVTHPTKPVTHPTKPVTHPTKPVNTKPVTPTKPVATPTKPVTQHSTKPATNPTTKPVANPSTKPSTPQPTTKPSPAPQQSSKGSMADNQNYIKQLWQLENGSKVGYNSKTGMWTGNAAPEKGGKVDYPGLKLPYKAGGYTQAEIDKAVKDKISGIESNLRKNVAAMGKNYDNLSEAQKKLLVDYSYNTGSAFGVFPKMSKAIVNGDVNAMNADYKRYWVDKSGQRREVLGRNQWTKSVIDSIGK